MTPFVSVDIETTGVDGSARVIEIGAIVVTADGELAARAHTLIRQDVAHLQRPASLAAQRVHGIAPAVLLDPSLPTEAEAAERIRRWLAAAAERYGARQVRAWNLPFERRFLSRPPWNLEDWGECLMAFAAQHVEGARGGKLKLEEAARALQIPRPGGHQHRALADAIRAALVVVHLEQLATVLDRPSLWLAIYAALLPPLMGLCPEIPGFTVDWSGTTSHGKTTALRLAASVWGCPDQGPAGESLAYGRPRARYQGGWLLLSHGQGWIRQGAYSPGEVAAEVADALGLALSIRGDFDSEEVSHESP